MKKKTKKIKEIPAESYPQFPSFIYTLADKINEIIKELNERIKDTK